MSHGSGKAAGLEQPPGCCDGSHQKRPVLWVHRGCSTVSSPGLSVPPHLCHESTLSIARPCCHHLPLLSVSPDLGPRLCSVLHRPIESQPTHSNSLNTSIKELYKGYKPLSYHKTSADLGKRGNAYTPFPASWSTADALSTCHNLHVLLNGEGVFLTDKSYPCGFGVITRLKNKSIFW